MHSGKDNAVTMLKIPQTVMCKCGLTLLCYLGYLGAAKWLTQPNKPRCQPTPLTTSIHRGLSSFPFLPPSFFLSTHHHAFTSPNHPPFIVSPRTETLSKTYNSPPFCSCCLIDPPGETHLYCPCA